MNYNRVHSLLSKASEAIVSSDGKIKKRLNNYETVVDPSKNDPFYVPDGAVNDNYGNLNYLTSEIRRRAMNAKLSKLRYAMIGTFAVVILVFLWSTYHFLLPSVGKNVTQTHSLSAGDGLLSTTVNEVQLERVANLIIIDDEWSKARITLFTKHWNASSDEEREAYRQTAWFQHFSYRLDTKFNRAIYTGELFGEPGLKKQPLYMLALTVGIADPDIDYLAGLEKNKNYMQLENEVTSELASLEKSRMQKDTNAQVLADEQILAKLLKDEEGKPLLVTPATENQVSSYADQQVSPNTSKTAEIVVTAARPPAINEQDVTRVFEKYASAYEKGSLEELSSLFGVSDPAQGQRILEQLKSNYKNVFENSIKRSVNFKGINWRFDGNQATVNSDYNAKIQLKNNKGIQTVTANAKLDLQKTGNDQLTIANFELLNRSVSVVTPELNINAAKPSVRKRPDVPTAAELQDIVTRLVNSYESGDLNTFSSLFSSDAKTNDRQNLAGIREDYQSLFRNSNDRQMFIQGMKWTFNDKHAKGTGDLEAIVLSESGSQVYSMGGKIQLVAQRIDGKVRITHMYHIEREK